MLSADVQIQKCTGCHGTNFEKAALGRSKIVNEMTSDEINASIFGYQDGSYGGPMKGLMKGQVIGMTQEDVYQVIWYINENK